MLPQVQELVRRYPRQPRSVRGTYIEVSVLVGDVPLPVFRRQDNVPFVPAILGQPYTLRVRSLHHGRLLVLSSVDGFNTLKREKASSRMGGLIWPSQQTDEIKGWRLDNDAIGDFVFEDPLASVAARSSEPNEPVSLGAIGFAVYTERFVQPKIRYEESRRRNPGGDELFQTYDVKQTFDIKEPRRTYSDVGTGIGEVRLDPVVVGTFLRATDQPAEKLVLQYRTEQYLIAEGIIKDEDPDPFPGDRLGDTGYGDLLIK